MKIKLRKYREPENHNRILISPYALDPLKAHHAMFQHCANGMVAVTEDEFKKRTQWALISHNIDFEIDNEI